MRLSHARRHRRTYLVALLVAGGITLGCGTDGNDTSDETDVTTPSHAASTQPAPQSTATTPRPRAPDPLPNARTDGPDVAAARTTAQGYFAAFAEADGASACALLSPASRTRFVEAVIRDTGQQVSCQDAFTQAAEGVSDTTRDQLRQARVVDVQIAGERGQAVVHVAQRHNTVRLVRIDGSWLIDNPPGQ